MKPKNPKIVFFADLDGTILNDKYSFAEAEPALRKLLLAGASIVLSSSKTRAEIEFFRRKLGIADPFVAENGSAIFIPKYCFSTYYEYTGQMRGYQVVEFGCPYALVREKLEWAKKRSGACIIGFGDMTAKEISQETGLSLGLAWRAKQREYSEPFKIVGGDEESVIRALHEAGLNCTKGDRYFHALGNCCKGKAAAFLKSLYMRDYGELVTVGVGNSPNDTSMMDLVDKPFWVSAAPSKGCIGEVWQQIYQYVREPAKSFKPNRSAENKRTAK